MTREEMLEKAERWLLDAEDNGDMEKRYIALSNAWVRLAAEVREGSALASLDVN